MLSKIERPSSRLVLLSRVAVIAVASVLVLATLNSGQRSARGAIAAVARVSAQRADDSRQDDQQPEFELLPVSPGVYRELIHPDESISSIKFEFSPDGTRMLGVTYPGASMAVWDVTTGEVLVQMQAEAGMRQRVPIFHVSPDWSTVYVAEYGEVTELPPVATAQTADKRIEGYVRAWDLATGEIKRDYQHDPPRGIRYMVLLPDGRRFATQDIIPQEGERPESRAVSVWDVETGEYREIAAEGLHIATNDGRLIVSRASPGDENRSIEMMFIDPESLETTLTISQPVAERTGVLSPDLRIMVGLAYETLQADGVSGREPFLVWRDARTGRELGRSALGLDVDNLQMRFSPDSQWIAVTTRHDWEVKLHVFRTDNRSLQHTIEFDEVAPETAGVIRRLNYSPDGRWLVVSVNRMLKRLLGGNNDNPEEHPQPRMYVIDHTTGQIAKTLIMPQSFVVDAKFSPDGKTLATTGNQKVLLWDWATIIKDVE